LKRDAEPMVARCNPYVAFTPKGGCPLKLPAR